MKHLFRILLAVTVVTAMSLSCKKEIIWDQTLEAAVTGSPVAYTGGDLTYTVTSFRTNSNGDKEFMP